MGIKATAAIRRVQTALTNKCRTEQDIAGNCHGKTETKEKKLPLPFLLLYVGLFEILMEKRIFSQ